MSTALRKLRLHFKDELLVRAGRKFELTPLAEQMKPDIDATVVLVEKLSPGQEPFDSELLALEFVAIVDDRHRVLDRDTISLADLGEIPQARATFGDRARPPGRKLFADEGITIDTAVVVAGFEVLPSLVDGTDLCAVVPRSLAQRAQRSSAISSSRPHSI